MDGISGEISPEKMNSLLTKLRFHKVTKDEAREFLLIFKNEIKEWINVMGYERVQESCNRTDRVT